MKVLVVVDMQNDFISGALGTKEARAIVPKVKGKITQYRANGDVVIFTRDTHGEDYMTTQEGKLLPVPHCIRETEGWAISGELNTAGSRIIDKPSFGSLELAEWVGELAKKESCQIELVGLCTDICILSNAVLLKAAAPEAFVAVDAVCCAGVSPESHKRALEAMKSCQIHIVNEREGGM